MNSGYIFYGDNILLLIFWQTWWFQLGVVIASVGGLLVFHLVHANRLKNDKLDLQRQLNERAELLAYCTDKEKKTRDDAMQANRKKSVLLARISHEIRTPLNGVLGMTALLAETTLTTEQQDYNETIRNCGESLLTVVNDILLNDILEYSKVDSATMELGHTDFELRTTVEEVLDVFASKAAQAGIEVMYEVDPNLPQQINGDSLRLKQILMNLMENALAHTSKGEVLIRVKVAESAGNTVKLAFEVIDSGAGIQEEKLKNLINVLSAPDASRSNGKGSGMGLVICKKLIELMGGHIELQSKVDVGTVVKFNIQADLTLQSGRNPLQTNVAALTEKKILLVEDNAKHQQILKQELEQWKLMPIVAESGSQALAILNSRTDIDLIISDMEMPTMNGIDLAQAVKQKVPTLPIILLTMPGDLRGKHHPELFSAVVSKPIHRQLLNKHVLTALKSPGNEAVAQQTTQKLSVDFSEKYPLRIIIAEDNPTNQKLAVKVLGKLGYKPDVANNGKEVLEIVSHKNYDLILMDVQMPEMDGLEATRMIRLCLETQPVIIAMTANTLQGDREECIKSGMDDYISKPINLEELVMLLEKWAFQVKAKQ